MAKNSRSGKLSKSSVATVPVNPGTAGPLPPSFVESLKHVPGLDDPRELMESFEGEAPVSIRFNPYKLSERPDGSAVPWSRYGFYLSERPQFTLDPLFHGGAYYVQEPSSMFVEHIFRSLFPEPENLRILDLCAAPGGKTTLLSTVAGLESLIIANEPIRSRAMVLADNVRKWGLGNVAVTNNDPSHFAGFRDYFDVVLVDAPCSGEGMFRKNTEAISEWSPEHVQLCASRQKRILPEVWNSLKPGGIMIYSTCTFNSAENEDVIEWITPEYDCEPIEIGIDPSWGIVAGESSQSIPTFRFFPHKVQGEGLFVSAFRKAEGKVRTKIPEARKSLLTEVSAKERKVLADWVAQPEYMHFANIADNLFGYYEATYKDFKSLSQLLSMVYSGVMMGRIFGSELRPEHSLAMFHDLNMERVPETCLDLETAVKYLRKDTLDPGLFAEGLNIVSFQGLPIGWAKRMGSRCNNMYPKGLRIMNF